jgi:hypothetical protein
MDAAVSSLLRNWSTAAASIWVGMPSADANPEGTTSWFAQPGRHLGHELIAAGLLILAGVTDRDQLQEAVRVGFERGRRSLQTPVGQLVPGAAGARVLHRDRPLPGDDDDASGSVSTPRVVASQPHSTSRSRALPRGSP